MKEGQKGALETQQALGSYDTHTHLGGANDNFPDHLTILVGLCVCVMINCAILGTLLFDLTLILS